MNTKSDTNTDDVILNKRSRHFLFTLNNPLDEEIKYIQSLKDDKRVQTLACQEEKGEKGTIHLQFAISYVHPRTFSACKKEFPRAHIEYAKNKWAVMNYCQKKETSTGNHIIQKGLTNTIIATAPNIGDKLEKKIFDLIKKKQVTKLKFDYWEKYEVIKWALVKYGNVCYARGTRKQVNKFIFNWLMKFKQNPEMIIVDCRDIDEDFSEQLKNGIIINYDTCQTIVFDCKKMIYLQK